MVILMKDFRISAAGIILNQNKVLLVRYKNNDGSSFLVGPGGGAFIEEDLEACVRREVFEETRVNVNPGKILFIEDLLSSKYRIIKIWFLCSVVDGEIQGTEEAKTEGIIGADWFSKDQILNETVYPCILNTYKKTLSFEIQN